MRRNDFLYHMQHHYTSVTSLFFMLLISLSWAQTIQLKGHVIANDDVENIHVINTTSKRFTTTNNLGVFEIPAKFQDTLQFTSVRYKTVNLIVSYSNVQSKSMTVYLEENVNVLDEVIVGKVLTGRLDSDIENSDAERPIDFYDLGLPGYKGPRMTQSERRLFEARSAQPGIIPLLPILNAISGRTKMLKERVRKERVAQLMTSIRDRLGQDFLESHPLEEHLVIQFYYFCEDDPDFEQRCRGSSDIEILEFLSEKYVEFKDQLKTVQD